MLKERTYKFSSSRGSINLELALLLTFLVFACIVAVIALSGGIDSIFRSAQSSVAAEISGPTGVIEGKVVDSGSGDPVPGVIVKIQDPNDTDKDFPIGNSDQNGDFSIEAPEGEYELIVLNPGMNFISPIVVEVTPETTTPIGTLPVTVNPPDGPPAAIASDWLYEENPDGTLTVYRYIGNQTQVSVPEEFEGKTVTAVRGTSSSNSLLGVSVTDRRKITEVFLPSTLKEIKAYALSDSNSIIHIDIPEGVTSIGYYAFYSCDKLTTVNLPSTLKTIGAGGFNNCNLVSVQIPEGTTSLGSSSFAYNSALKDISLPSTLETFGTMVFSNCISLIEVEIPEGMTLLSTNLFFNCTSLLKVTLPSTLTAINGGSFLRCTSLVDINFPLGLNSIGQNSFKDCWSLSEVNLPTGLKTIAVGAFINCTSLEEITIPNSVDSRLITTFEGCSSLNSVTIGTSVPNLWHGAFRNCTSLTEITIPNNVYDYVLSGTVIHEGLTADTFSGCSALETINVDKNVDSLVNAPWGAPSATVVWLR